VPESSLRREPPTTGCLSATTGGGRSYVKILITLAYGEGSVRPRIFLGLNLWQQNGAVGAAQVSWFPG
jgi:hypothetical protein